MTRFGRHPGEGIKALTGTVVRAVLADASLPASDLEAVWFSNSGWGMTGGQHCIRGQVALAPLGLGQIPVMNVENACAGGSSAFHGAFLGVASGAYDVALAIGAETDFTQAAAGAGRDFSRFLAATDVEEAPALAARLAAEAEAARAELRARGQVKAASGGPRSPAMDVYSARARAHMRAYGTTQRQLAVIAARNHRHGSLNPLAQYRMPMTAEEVLDDRLVSWPLTRAMCAPVGESAAAAILIAGDSWRRSGDRRAVRVLASVLASGLPQAPGGRAGRTRRLAPMTWLASGPPTSMWRRCMTRPPSASLPRPNGSGSAPKDRAAGMPSPAPRRWAGHGRSTPAGAWNAAATPSAPPAWPRSPKSSSSYAAKQVTGRCPGARLGLTQNSGGLVGTGPAAYAVHIFQGAS